MSKKCNNCETELVSYDIVDPYSPCIIYTETPEHKVDLMICPKCGNVQGIFKEDKYKKES